MNSGMWGIQAIFLLFTIKSAMHAHILPNLLISISSLNLNSMRVGTASFCSYLAQSGTE